eukprot:TRINITY_DN49102_c0_g1_i1.p1 TRINITY_DN49102_c0_g1~~TRINITY_DN49102_c0_g1_i1.p1  ORF type:complete len:172 (-),score=41.11 TRINITY_DN49102_c0_g1_i1:52-567(-)
MAETGEEQQYTEDHDNVMSAQEAQGVPQQVDHAALQSMAMVTSQDRPTSIKLTFESKGKRVEQEFHRRPLGFEISAEKKTKMFSCGAGVLTGRFCVNKVTSPDVKAAGVEKGMMITQINAIDCPQDMEDYEFLEMFQLALSVLPDATPEEIAAAEEAETAMAISEAQMMDV